MNEFLLIVYLWQFISLSLVLLEPHVITVCFARCRATTSVAERR
jgi:hypothetical protein